MANARIELTDNELVVLKDALNSWDSLVNVARFAAVEPWTWHALTRNAYKRAVTTLFKKLAKL